MANRQTNLDINVTANDNASRTLDKIAGDARELEDGIEVDVGVDDQATDELADIRAKLDSLSDEDRVIALRATATQLEAEVGRAERSLGRLDKFDGDEVRVRVEARDNASKKLDAIQAELRDLDGETVRVDVQAPGVDSLTSKLENLGGGAGVAASLGRGGLIGGLALGMNEVASSAADVAIEAQVVADLTGDSVEEASKLLAVWRDAGFETNDILDILLQMNGTLRDNPELADDLNVKLGDGKGLVERFIEVVGNLQTEIDDAGERADIMSRTFGEEGVRQVQSMITVVGDLETKVDGVSASRIVTDADVQRARDYRDAWTETKGRIDGIKQTVGQGLLPAVNSALGGDPRDLVRLATNPATYAQDLLRQNAEAGRRPAASAPLVSDVVGDVNSLRDALTVTIINPPGTPAATVNQTRVYDQRNGDRFQ